MAYKTGHDGEQRIMNHLVDSVFELSDEEILAEVRESGVDPHEEADRTSCVLRQAVDTWESENERLSNLGHAINSSDWRPGQWGYHNNCLNCGSSVSFTTATGEMRGEAFEGLCPERDQYAIHRRKASRCV
jgi:hypothetical protein